MKKNLLIAALLASMLLSACSAGAVRPSPTVIAPTLIQTREMATDTPSPTLTSAPTPTPTPIPKPTPTSTSTPEPTPTSTPTERPVPKEVTRIPGLTLRFNAEKGYWQYLDSDGRPVAHFSQTEHGKRIEIDVDNLDFEKHPELRGLFEPATSAQLARFEKEAIKNDPWVFILPVPMDEVAELATIEVKVPYGIYHDIGIKLEKTNGPVTLYAPVSGKAIQGRGEWSKTDWTSYLRVVSEKRGKKASFYVGTVDDNLKSLLKVPMGAAEWRQIGIPMGEVIRPSISIPFLAHSSRIIEGKGEYQIIIFPGSSHKELWKELLDKGTYSHILRDPKTGKLLSIEAGKKSSRRKNNRRLASRQRKLAEAQAKAAIASAKARGNWN